MSVTVTAHTENGDVDITEGVQALYDIVIGSMDWGSGFLTIEEALPVVHVGRTCGFREYEEAERYVTALQKSQEQIRLMAQRRRVSQAELDEQTRWLREHEHVYNDSGLCVYPACRAAQQPTFTAKMTVKGSTDDYRTVEWTMKPEGHRIRVDINGPLSSDAITAFEQKIRDEATS